MIWAYLLVFNDAVGERSDVTKFLDEIESITHWHACFPNAVFLTSSDSAGAIYDRLKQRFGTDSGKRYFLTEVAKDRQGWMTKEAWHMLKNPDSPRLKE